MYDSIVIGAGIAGSVAARKLAEEGKTPLIFAKNNSLLGIIAAADVEKKTSR